MPLACLEVGIVIMKIMWIFKDRNDKKRLRTAFRVKGQELQTDRNVMSLRKELISIALLRSFRRSYYWSFGLLVYS